MYPNPFAGLTTVDFTLTGSGQYSVILYDTKGKKDQEELRHGWANAGVRNLVSVDGSHLAAGVYYIKVHTGEKTQTLKLLKR